MRILTYNTHLFLGTIVPGVQYRDEDRMANLIARIRSSDADVVGLCEVWSDRVKSDIAGALARPYPYSYFHATAATQMGSGLLLLSKHLLSRTSFVQYADLVGADALSEKGFYTALASVKKPDGSIVPVFLVLTHTQSGDGASDAGARASNLTQLSTGIRQLPFAGKSLYVMGDFNVRAETNGKPTPEYMQLKKRLAPCGLEDLCRVVHPSPSDSPMPTYDWFANSLARYFDPGDQVRSRLDYVFARDAGTPSMIQFSVPVDWKVTNSPPIDTSDHYPIVVTTPS